MPPDPARVAETREWLQKASLDLRGARLRPRSPTPAARRHAVPLPAGRGGHDKPFRKTHSLEELGAAFELIDVTLRSVIDPAVPLTEFAWAFRYPGDHPTPTVEEARQGLATAVSAIAGVVPRFPPEAVPPALLDLIR